MYFQERYPHEKGFSAHFQRYINPLLEKMETNRQATLRLFYIVLLVWILALAWVKTGSMGSVFIAASIFILGFVCLGGIYMRYINHNKSIIMPHLIRFFDDLQYDHTRHIAPQALEDFGILPSYEFEVGEDYISRAGSFESSELLLTRIDNTARKRRVKTVFKGLVLRFTLPQRVSSRIILKPDGGVIGNWLSGLTAEPRIALEDPLFERLFQVYSQDQIEARRVLQPALMSRLLQLSLLMENWGADLSTLPQGARPAEMPDAAQLKTYGVRFSASFKGNELLMLIPCRHNLFESGSLFTSAYDIGTLRCTLYQITLITLIQQELLTFRQLNF